MDDPLNIHREPPFEDAEQPERGADSTTLENQILESVSEQFAESTAEPVGAPFGDALSSAEASKAKMAAEAFQEAGREDFREAAELRRSKLRHNLFLLLSLSLAAFTLTAWIFVRLDSPFGIFSTGPQEIVRAQLLALDRGEVRPAYDMFSARYRNQVSFDDWHKLIVTHWRMFHAEVLRSGTPAQKGPGVTLEIYLHGEDDKDYRARFTLVRSGGRWWIDDVHWTEQDSDRDFIRS